MMAEESTIGPEDPGAGPRGGAGAAGDAKVEKGEGEGNLFNYWGDAIGKSVTSFFGGDGDGDGGGARGAQGESPGTMEEVQKTAKNLAGAATRELESASRAAQRTFGKAAVEIGQGWGSLNRFLDGMLQGGENEGRRNVGAREHGDLQAEFRKRFPKWEEDDVVDGYRCTLMQKYRCCWNNATPERTFRLRGKLFVTVSRAAMYVDDDGGAFGGKEFGVVVQFADVEKLQKGAKATLRLLTKSQQSFVFSGFESEEDFSGAFSLLEHMTTTAEPLDTNGDRSASTEIDQDRGNRPNLDHKTHG